MICSEALLMSIQARTLLQQKLNKMFDCINEQAVISKTFVFENQTTHQSTILDYSIHISSEYIPIDSILEVHCPISDNHVSIYHPILNKFSPISHHYTLQGHIDKDLILPPIILIRFNRRDPSTNDYESEEREKVSDFKKMEEKDGKSKERNIQQVIEVVKQWRDLHHNQRQTMGQKRRINLQEAAKMVGISKKSLDDYYCQLRLAQLYHFDFSDNLHQKIGVLRTFIKNYRPSKLKKAKGNDKHPKHLKVIQMYDMERHRIRRFGEMVKVEFQPSIVASSESIAVREKDEEKERYVMKEAQKKDDVVSLVSLNLNQSGGEPLQMFDLEHDFFKDFDVEAKEEKDPYYDVDLDFRKKDNDFDSFNNMLFFD